MLHVVHPHDLPCNWCPPRQQMYPRHSLLATRFPWCCSHKWTRSSFGSDHENHRRPRAAKKGENKSRSSFLFLLNVWNLNFLRWILFYSEELATWGWEVTLVRVVMEQSSGKTRVRDHKRTKESETWISFFFFLRNLLWLRRDRVKTERENRNKDILKYIWGLWII